MPNENEVNSSALLSAAQFGDTALKGMARFFDPYGKTERKEYRDIRKIYQAHLSEAGLEMPHYFSAEEPQCPSEGAAPLRESYHFESWRVRIGSGYFEACSKVVISRICEYETNRKGNPRHPTHLFFKETKEFFVKLSGKPIPKDERDLDYKALAAYEQIIGDLEVDNVFEPSSLPTVLRSGEKTRNATLIDCKREINATLTDIKKNFRNVSTREQLEKLLGSNKSLVSNIFEFLVFSLCPFELPQLPNINYLSSPKNEKLKYFFQSKPEGIGARLRQLSLSEPIKALISQKSESQQASIPDKVATLAAYNQWQSSFCVELKQCLSGRDKPKKKEKNYAVYEYLQDKDEIIDSFFHLYCLLYQYAELSELFSLLYRLSGAGGDLTVCGITRETSLLLFQEQARLCDLISKTLEEFYKGLSSVYENMKKKNKRQDHWVSQQAARKHYKEKIDAVIADILRSNSKISEKMSVSREQMIREAAEVVRALNSKAIHYVELYHPPDVRVLSGSVAFLPKDAKLDQSMPGNFETPLLLSHPGLPLKSHTEPNGDQLSTSEVMAKSGVSFFAPSGGAGNSCSENKIVAVSSSLDPLSVTVQKRSVSCVQGSLNSVIEKYKYKQDEWVVSVHRLVAQQNCESAVILVEGVKDKQEFIRKFTINVKHRSNVMPSTFLFYWARNKAYIDSVFLELESKSIQSEARQANCVLPVYAEKLIQFIEKIQAVSDAAKSSKLDGAIGDGSTNPGKDFELIEYETESYQSINTSDKRQLECYQWCLRQASKHCNVNFFEGSYIEPHSLFM